MPYITSTTTEVWPSAIRKSPLVQTSEAQSTVSIIYDVLTDKISAREAAQSISSLYKPELRQDASLSSLWTIIVDAIRNTTGNGVTLQRLARAMAHLSRVPDAVGDNGQALKSKSGLTIWRDLPDFSSHFLEDAFGSILKLIDGIADPPSQEIVSYEDIKSGSQAARTLMNANTFAALYLREIDDGPQLEFSNMRKVAREHFTYTLEVPFDTPARVRRAEIYMKPAAAWINIAGFRLYKYSKANRDYTGEDVAPGWIGGEHDGGTVMWDKRDGFSVERWTFWRNRFEEFSQLESADAEAKKQAAISVRRMRELE